MAETKPAINLLYALIGIIILLIAIYSIYQNQSNIMIKIISQIAGALRNLLA